MSDADIENLAAFYAHKQPKAVIFVRMPSE